MFLRQQGQMPVSGVSLSINYEQAWTTSICTTKAPLCQTLLLRDQLSTCCGSDNLGHGQCRQQSRINEAWVTDVQCKQFAEIFDLGIAALFCSLAQQSCWPGSVQARFALAAAGQRFQSQPPIRLGGHTLHVFMNTCTLPIAPMAMLGLLE